MVLGEGRTHPIFDRMLLGTAVLVASCSLAKEPGEVHELEIFADGSVLLKEICPRLTRGTGWVAAVFARTCGVYRY